MMLDRALARMERMKLGEGGFSATYDIGDGRVMKVPLEQRSKALSKGRRFAPLFIRKQIVQDVYESTEWLRAFFPNEVIPVTIGMGGVIYQKKLVGHNFYDMSRHSDKHPKEWEELVSRLQHITDRAFNLRIELDKVSKPRWGYVDTGWTNFMISDDFKIIGWFDPFVPSREAYEGRRA